MSTGQTVTPAVSNEIKLEGDKYVRSARFGTKKSRKTLHLEVSKDQSNSPQETTPPLNES